MKTILLTKDKRVLVDENDFKQLSRHKWHLSGTGYAARGRKGFLMHREIMQPPTGLTIDHIDGDKLNNSRSNLRLATPQENCRNKKVKGVWKRNNAATWTAYITVNRIRIWLGSFKTEAEATLRRRRAEKEYFGDFAYNHGRGDD